MQRLLQKDASASPAPRRPEIEYMPGLHGSEFTLRITGLYNILMLIPHKGYCLYTTAE